MNNAQFKRLYQIYNTFVFRRTAYLTEKLTQQGREQMADMWMDKGNRVSSYTEAKFIKKYPVEYEALRQPLLAKVRERTRVFHSRQTRLLDCLINHANEVTLDPLPELRFINSTWSNDYRSTNQGAKYAFVALKVQAVRLIKFGFKAVIKEFAQGDSIKYELWSDADDYQVFCLILRDTKTDVETIAFYWANGVNPFVYNPWFKHDLVQPFDTAWVYNPNVPVEQYKI